MRSIYSAETVLAQICEMRMVLLRLIVWSQTGTESSVEGYVLQEITVSGIFCVNCVVGTNTVGFLFGDFSKSSNEMSAGFLIEHKDQLAQGTGKDNGVIRVDEIAHRTDHVPDENWAHLVEWM